MILASPWFLITILPIVGLWYWQRKTRTQSTFKYPDVKLLAELGDRKTVYLSKVVSLLRFVMLIVIVIALVRPQTVNKEKEILSEGVDIMLVLDVSGSMKAEDFKPNNRLEVAKSKVKEFIEKRDSDRIGLVVFSGEAFTKCPLTVDYGILNHMVNEVTFDMAGDGTAIGLAIATGLNRLKDSDAKSKIMILLTDGENNRGQIEPLSAAKLANDLGVRVYTIGVGKKGGAPIPYTDPVFGKQYIRSANGALFLTKIDEPTLKRISATSGGRYFRAEDANALTDVYDQIDALEKTKVKMKRYYHYFDFFPYLLWAIFGLFMTEIMLASLFLVRVP